ncbi:universal stress protein [Devosia sp. 1635]|uniref:universal stress protein n=1 Tax=Devosia sp. 1635 TaxID=2726066 RepID=UPI0015678E2B|nr:universal stress protein [Devosia sp. 1635]
MIKDIVVHLTGSDEDRVRLDYAETLAGVFDAHLTGLLVHLEPELVASPGLIYADVLPTLMDEAAALTRQRREVLAARFALMVVPNDLRIVSGVTDTVGEGLAAEARASDLFIGTRPYGDPDKNYRDEEGVLFGSGGPALFLPPQKPASFQLENVLVAWKNQREAARAIKDALPILKKAQQVVLAVVTDEPEEQAQTSSGADIARYLSRHDIHGEIKELAGWRSAAEALLSEARLSGADLVVAGAYGRSRLRERVLGGVTRALLSKCDVPVLMSR